MNLLDRLSWMKPRGEAPGDGEERNLTRSLEAEARRLRSVDPETSFRWHSLKAAIETLEATPPLRMRRALRFRLATAGLSLAVLSAAAIIATVLFVGREPSILTFETAKGEHSTITLEDGSEVTLNHTTELTAAAGEAGKGRAVSLKGEAYFRVRRTGVPFTVTTELGKVEVLGTEFNVRVRDDRLEVAVNGGSVRVSAHLDGRDSSVVLAPGEIASCRRGTFPGAPERMFFAEYPGWMHGKLLFQKANLLSVCREIEAQFDVTIRIEKQQVGDETITGALDARKVEAAIATLSRLSGTSVRHEQNVYTLY